jgi:signal peptidase I
MKKIKSFARAMFRFARNLFAFIGLILVVYYLFFNVTVIYSDSMSPTLKGNETSERDYVLTEKISYLLREPRRWEIVRYQTDDELSTLVMKRVVGLKGETISIKDHWININGKPIERPIGLEFLKYYAVGDLFGGKEVDCDGGYFMLGDDSKDSYDSRFTGIIKSDIIEGRAWMIIWPPSRIRLLSDLSYNPN